MAPSSLVLIAACARVQPFSDSFHIENGLQQAQAAMVFDAQ
jgi:hypothetical protein